jgi:hypothetical protein
MGYMNDISRIFIYEFEENRISADDLLLLQENFERRAFHDGRDSFYYDFRFVPTGKLLELKHRIPDNSNNNRRRNEGELILSDFMSVEAISLLTHFDYAGEKIHSAVNQMKTYEISDFWEFHFYCPAKSMLSLTTELLAFMDNHPDIPVLTYLEIWDKLPEGDRDLLKKELSGIRLLAEVAARNGFDLLLLPTLDF